MGSGTAYFELSFCPSLALVSTVRRFVATFYENVLTDPDVISRVALAAHELLENAVKYAIDGETNIRVDVAPLPGAAGRFHVCIRTRNASRPGDVAALRETFAALAASPDPLEFYTGLMASKASSPERGGLGLGRIAAEAEMALALDVGEDGMVEIRATADVMAHTTATTRGATT